MQSPKINLIITKWVDEAGNDLKPADAKAPAVLGGPNEALEHGTISGYVFLRTEEDKENNIVKHIFKAISSSRPNIQTDNEDRDNNGGNNNTNDDKPKPDITKTDITKPGKISNKDSNKKSKHLLAKTGTKDSNTSLSIGGLSIFGGLGLLLFKKKREDEESEESEV